MPSPSPETPAAELLARLRETPPRPDGIARFLDGLTPGERVDAIRAVGRSEQRRLYQAVDGFAPLRLADLVPDWVPEFSTVRHYGKNTLPVFSQFEKRFCRPRAADPRKPELLYGFNFQSLSVLTGPGYFVAREDSTRPEVRIDYREVPPEHPDGWPAILTNDGGLSRFVYGRMVDVVRRVSEHVSIGTATRGGREIGSWFLLCREARPGERADPS